MTFNILLKMDQEELAGGIVALLFWCGTTLYITTQCTLMFSIRSRLKIFNEILKSEKDLATFLSMSSLHIDLCELVITVNKITSFTIISTIGMSVFDTTFIFFEFYDLLICEQKDFMRILFSFCSFLVLIHFLINFFLIIIVCALTKQEGMKTINVLHDKISKEVVIWDRKTMKRYQIFLIQLDHFNVNDSCGLFRLDWKVLMMFLGSVTSFLIILIQFESFLKGIKP
ncbi:hypothetical protein ACKWTF_016594 [Chironomus riparius]